MAYQCGGCGQVHEPGVPCSSGPGFVNEAYWHYGEREDLFNRIASLELKQAKILSLIAKLTDELELVRKEKKGE